MRAVKDALGILRLSRTRMRESTSTLWNGRTPMAAQHRHLITDLLVADMAECAQDFLVYLLCFLRMIVRVVLVHGKAFSRPEHTYPLRNRILVFYVQEVPLLTMSLRVWVQ